MNEVDIDRFLERLREFDAIRESDTINRGTVDRIKPTHADEWPRQLNPAVRDALVAAGIPQPYQHQAEAINKALTGADVVMESPTASGKNACIHRSNASSLEAESGFARDDDLSDEGIGL